MNISALFIHRPAGTTLLTIALALAGLIAYQFLPVASLPQVEFPTIQVQAQLPGASPEIMASAVATHSTTASPATATGVGIVYERWGDGNGKGECQCC